MTNKLGLKGTDFVPGYAFVEMGRFFFNETEGSSFGRIMDMPDIEGKPYASAIRRGGFGLYWTLANAVLPGALLAYGISRLAEWP